MPRTVELGGVELLDDATPAQRQRVEADQGGAMLLLMCVDKRPDELAPFDVLTQESSQFGHDLHIIFAATMSGTLSHAPTSNDAEEPLQRMVEAIKRGEYGAFIPFAAQGHAVQMGKSSESPQPS